MEKQEKREYSRLDVSINGTLYNNNQQIPITIANISENGIGLKYKKSMSPVDFKVSIGQKFSIMFVDDKIPLSSGKLENQQCVFEVVHTREGDEYVYIGAKLVHSQMNYPLYVSNKKVSEFTVGVRCMDFTPTT